MRKETSIGLLVLTVSLILKRYVEIPDIMLGALTGISIGFCIVGILPKTTYNNLQQWKQQKISRFR